MRELFCIYWWINRYLLVSFLDGHNARSTAEHIGLAGSWTGDYLAACLALQKGYISNSEQPHSVSRHHALMGLEPRDWSGRRHAVAEAKDDGRDRKRYLMS